MTTTTKDPSLAEHYDSLPKGLQKAIAESGWEASMREISAYNHLHIDQADTIAVEIMRVMIGLADPLEFYAEIQEKAHIDPALAEKITLEVNDKIFQKIRTELVALYQDRQVNGEAEAGGEDGDEDAVESREELLAEIEKPVERVTLGLARIPGAARAAAPEPEKAEAAPDEPPAPPAPPALPPPPAPPGPSPVFLRKLEERVTSAAPKISAAAPAQEKPRASSIDPYREPPTA